MSRGSQDFKFGTNKDKRSQKAFKRQFDRLLNIEEKNAAKRNVELTTNFNNSLMTLTNRKIDELGEEIKYFNSIKVK